MTRGRSAHARERALRLTCALSVATLLGSCDEGEPQRPNGGLQIIAAPDAATTVSSSAATAGGANAAVGWCGVKKVLDRACVACHANPPVNNAPLPLTSYAELTVVSPLSPDQKVYESVVATLRASRSELGRYSPMPPGAPLPPADLALIEAWVTQGAPPAATPVCPP